MSRMTYAEGVSAKNLQADLAGLFLSKVVGRVDTAHITLTAKGRSKAAITGEFTGVTFEGARTSKVEQGILFNPSLLEKLRLFFNDNDVPAYVDEKGEIGAVAPISTDVVLSLKTT